MKSLFAIGTLMLPFISNAQVGFEKTYGTTSDDEGYYIQKVSGGYLITGYTHGSQGGKDVYMLKVDASGKKIFEQTLGVANDDIGHCIVSTSNGNVVVAATMTYDAEHTLNFAAKLNSSASAIVWAKNPLSFTDSKDNLYGVVEASDGNFVFTGTWQRDMFAPHAVLMKIDATTGDTLWARFPGGGTIEFGYNLIKTTDGGYLVSGTFNTDDGNLHAYMWKADANGHTEWSKDYGTVATKGTQVGADAIQTKDGGYILVGSNYYEDGTTGTYLVKTNASGDTSWTRIIKGNELKSSGNSIRQTSDGGYIICGMINYGLGKADDVLLLKVDGSGKQQWLKTFVGDGYEEGRCLQITDDGGYIIVGYTDSKGAGGKDLYLVKTDKDGNTTSSIADNSLEESRITLSPNPSKGRFNLLYDASSGADRYEVADMSGRVVYAGRVQQHPTPVDLSFVKDGLYIVKVYSPAGIACQKLVISR